MYLFHKTFEAFTVEPTCRKNLKIPEFVFNSSINTRLSFLAGLFDTDGYLKANANKPYSDFAIASKSYALASDLVLLLGTLGVKASYRLDFNKTYQKYYYIVNIPQQGLYDLGVLGLADYLVVPRKKEAITQRLLNKPMKRKMKPATFIQLEKGKTEKVYDITVDQDPEFYASGHLVHNCLAVVYGANAARLSMNTGRPIAEHDAEIKAYKKTYPGLPKYMNDSETSAKLEGIVKTRFGRIRHLPLAKEYWEQYGENLNNRWRMHASCHPDPEEGKRLYNQRHVLWAEKRKLSQKKKQTPEDLDRLEELNELIKETEIELRMASDDLGGKIYSKFRNMMNNAKNSPIQMSAAHIANAAAIKFSQLLKANNIDGWPCMQVHDEITAIVREDQAEFAAVHCLQEAMENNWVTEQINIPILAEPLIADKLSEAKD